MTTLGINWNGLWNLLTEEVPQPETTPPSVTTESQKESHTEPYRLKISVKDLECVSDALLHYTKHLAGKGEYDRMQQVKELDKHIFTALEAMTSFSEEKETAIAA